MTPAHVALRRFSFSLAAAFLILATLVPAQQDGTLSPAEQQRRHDLEKELQYIAIVERKVMMPMRWRRP